MSRKPLIWLPVLRRELSLVGGDVRYGVLLLLGALVRLLDYSGQGLAKSPRPSRVVAYVLRIGYLDYNGS